MAMPYVAGPCHIYVGVGATTPIDLVAAVAAPLAAASIRYLGTCEQAPSIRINPRWVPVMNDITGPAMPYDQMWCGEDADAVGDLTIWNEAVYTKLGARPNFEENTRGIYGAQDMGSLMVTEGFAYPVYFHFPYNTKAPYTNSSAPAGYRFYAGWMAGPDEIMPGTKPNKRRVVFHFQPIYKCSDGTIKLYDHTLTNIPAYPPCNASGILSSS